MSRPRPKPYPLKANFHDGQLEAVEFGPRREVTLSVRLDPVWNGGDARVQRLQLSAVENYEEVRAFFARATAPDAERPIAEVIGVVRAADGVVGLDLTRLGYVEVRTRKVREP